MTRSGKRTATVTRAFLFSDLREYTRFVEAHGDAAAAGLLREYRALVRREVRRHTGAEVKTEGDSFYVVFESPAAALECGVAILKGAAEHTRLHGERPLRIGMGLHAGETVPFDDQFVGSAVNIGARLASKAGPGELIISDTFRGLVRTGVTYAMTDRGPLRLKGLSERIRAWRVDWDGGTPAATPLAGAPAPAAAAVPLPSPLAPPTLRSGELLCPILVGRERELEVVDAALVDAVAGHGAVLLVSGEAGVGKSALLRELERRAHEASFVLLPGATLESDAGLPYAPFISAIRLGYRDANVSEWRTALERLAPDLASLFPELGRAERERAAVSVVERHRIPIAFSTFLGELSAHAPVLLLLEDIHWADEASLALLERLAREVARWRVVIAATYRSDEMHRLHPLQRTVAGIRRDRLARELALLPLGREETVRLITAAAEDHRIDPDVAETIYRRTQGNPFFTEELLRAVVDGSASAPVPASVRDAVRARLTRLSAASRATVAVASVIGDRARSDVLCTVRGIGEVELSDQLHEAIDEQILVELDDIHEPAYAFRHALTREVVYEQMLLPERRRLHLRVAEALAGVRLTPASTLAEHWRLGGDRDKAAEAYARAAQRALALYAPVEAVAHVESAIEMRGSATLDDYETLARAYLFFDVAKARDAAKDGLELMAGDADTLRRIGLMRLAGRALSAVGDADGNAALANEAWTLAEAHGDPKTRAHAADWVANAAATRGHMADAREWAERAIETARASGELAVEANALATLAISIADRRPIDALRLVEDAAAIARRTGSADVMARVHQNGVVDAFSAESERPRLVRIERGREFALRYGLRRPIFETFLLWHDMLALHWPEPSTAPTEISDDLFSAWTELLHVLMEACRGGPAAAERSAPLVDRARKTGEPQWAVPWLGWRALLLEWAGDREGSRAATAEMLAMADRHHDPAIGLTALARGLNAPAVLAFLAGDAETLGRMDDALAEAQGHAGDRDAIAAFRSALDGRDARECFERAAADQRKRGLRLSIAVDLWALASRGAVTAEWAPVTTAVTEELRRAGAEWLAREIQRLSAEQALRR